MTKVSVFGQPTEQKELKPIEFVKCLYSDNDFSEDFNESEWDNVTLITRNHNGAGMDLILCYPNDNINKDGSVNKGVLYLGHWNDGVVK